MKRGGPLKRRTPLARKTRIKQRSAKRADVYEREGGRRDIVRRRLLENPYCQAGQVIGAYLAGAPFSRCDRIWAGCIRDAQHVHEVIPRGRGGSILDDANLLNVCSICHGWIHQNNDAAESIGLLAKKGPSA